MDLRSGVALREILSHLFNFVVGTSYQRRGGSEISAGLSRFLVSHRLAFRRFLSSCLLSLCFFLSGGLVSSIPSVAQGPELSKVVKEFVRVSGPRVVLTHARVIDGTGAAAVEDQNVVIENGKIAAIEKGADGEDRFVLDTTASDDQSPGPVNL